MFRPFYQYAFVSQELAQVSQKNADISEPVVTICFAASAQTKKLEADFSFLPDVR